MVVMKVHYKEMQIQTIFYHIMPFKKIPKIMVSNLDLDMVQIHQDRILSDYKDMRETPLRERCVIEYFGDDVGSIIISFTGRFHGKTNIGRKMWEKNKNGEWMQCIVVDEMEEDYHRGHRLRIHDMSCKNDGHDFWMTCKDQRISFKYPIDTDIESFPHPCSPDL